MPKIFEKYRVSEKGRTLMAVPTRILFARIGWMTFYNGAREERPQGGGSYNKRQIGSELFNFEPVKGFLYGFVNAGSGRRAINLWRLDPGAKAKDALEGVIVVFVARHPRKGGQRVIGWYGDATVYATKKPHPLTAPYKKNIVFSMMAPATKACLLPTAARDEEVPGGSGGMGQSNVRYDDGKSDAAWVKRVMSYIASYDGPNLLRDKGIEAEQNDAAEIVIETAAGFETNPKIRTAIEKHAMRLARRHFEKLGFSVKIIGKPYDLLCTKSDCRKFVEVKGTRTQGAAIALTRNEVEFLGKNASSAALFVVHSINLKNGKNPKAYGGETKLVEPWNPFCGVLTPITYFFRFNIN